jgi:subtilase family serine protease
MKTFYLTFLFLLMLVLNINECESQSMTTLNNSYGHGNLSLVKTGNLNENINLTLTLVTGSSNNTKLVSAYYLSLVRIISQNDLDIKIEANVSVLSQVFNTSFATYLCPTNSATQSNRTCFASTSMVSIPTSLKTAILGIIGLEQVLNLTTGFKIGRNLTASLGANYIGPNVAKIYGFPNSTGAGVRVGIITLGGYFNQSDLQLYFTKFGLGTAPKINMAFIDGSQLDYSSFSSTVENYLDVEIIATVAPQSNITLYFAPNYFPSFYNVIFAALEQSDVLSISWGTYEVYAAAYLTSFQALFARFSHVPIFIATGDQGSSIGVGFPACCPNAIGKD